MSPFDLFLAVIVPALSLLGYGLIKTRRTLLEAGPLAALVAGAAATFVALAFELALGRVMPLRSLTPVGGCGGTCPADRRGPRGMAQVHRTAVRGLPLRRPRQGT
jgi:hypothetical protein